MAEDHTEKKEQNDIWYSFRTEELELLLAAAGAKSWYGPSGGRDGKAVSREEVNRLLAGLYRKGMVSFDDGRLAVSEEQKKIAEMIRDTVAVASPYCGVKSGVPYVAYFSKSRVVILRTDKAGSGRVIVKVMDEADWPGFLLGESPAICKAAGAHRQADAELEINGEGLRRAASELEGCGDILKRISSEIYATASKADTIDAGSRKVLDDAQKTLELKGSRLNTMAEVLVRTVDEADLAEKMILDHEAVTRASQGKAGESDLSGMAEMLEKAVRR